MSENWNFQPMFASYNATYQRARVGLAVLCRCKDSCVQCLLQKRGPSSSTPNKWSFPGGRLEQPGDLDEDGAVGTRRELMEGCGGGVPPGLPDLIHIECCKSGKSKQTLYHVYVIDSDSGEGWDNWTPAAQGTKDALIDASVKYLALREHQFPSVNGYSWVDMSVLIHECVELNTDRMNNSELQHGLVRWVQMYGDHILRTLMARSPKLGHTVRRYSGSSSNTGGRPRANSGGRLRRFSGRVSSTGTLQPPFGLGQFVRPQFQGTPFVGVLPPGSEQFSPPHHLNANQNGGVVIPVPSPPSPRGVYGAPPPAPYQCLFFVQSPPPSIPPPPLLPSPSHTNLIAVGTGDECLQSRLWPSQDTQLPGPQDLLSERKAHPFMGTTPPVPMTTPPVPVTTAGLLSPVLTPPPTHKDIVCKHFMVGQCPFGQKCWFAHPESTTQQTFVQASDGVCSPSPLHGPTPSPNPSHGGPTPPIPSYNGSIDQALQWRGVEAMWPHLVPGVYRGRPTLFPGGLSPGQPFFYLRPPLPGAHVPNAVHLFPSPNPPHDTALTFALLSEVVVRGTQGDVIREVSHLAVFADHFYLSFGSTVQAYKVLFGGTRSYQDSSVVQECCTLKHKVTCLHCSRPVPSLLAIGTAAGGVYTWDMKRGPRILTTLHEPEEIGHPVTALIHFLTSINVAQVVVVGGAGGTLTWYISQPPQKTFSVLFTDSRHSPVPVVSLQILGGLLLSGGKDGKIFLWNMSKHHPQLDSVLSIHCSVLKDIHILQGNSFLTVGISPADTTPSSSLCIQSQTAVTEGLNTPTNGHHNNSAVVEQPDDSHQVDDALTNNMSDLNIHSSDVGRGEGVANWCASLWDNERPPKCTRTVHLGSLMSNAFYHHPNVGNMFLCVGMEDGRVKIYNIPSFNVACELRFSELSGKDCIWVALNLSREPPPVPTRSPFRDLLLTTVWSDGKVMICQAQKQQ